MFTYLLLSSSTVKSKDEDAQKLTTTKISIGAIVDYSSRIGKEENIAMNIAADDFYYYTNYRPVVHIVDSRKDPTHAASAATELIKKKQVGAILGSWKWETTTSVAEVGAKAQVPILSLADTAPSFWNAERWPFLIQAAHSQDNQMSAVAAILETGQWRKVNIIYEDSTFTTISQLIETLRKAGICIDHLLSFPPLPSSLSMSEVLQKIKHDWCRVFIVHTSLPLAEYLLSEAKKIGLMGNDSVWMTTSSSTDLMYSVNVSIFSSMQGIVGIKTYFPQSGASFENFKSKFRRNFLLDYPHEVSSEPGIVALQAYDALWAVALAMWGKTNQTSKGVSANKDAPLHGKQLLQKIAESNFVGLTGEFRFEDRKLDPTQVFQVGNLAHNNYRELGYWSNGQGFSDNIKEGAIYNRSMKILQEVVWPGGSRTTIPRGWAPPKPLIIGVPLNSTFKEFMNVEYIGEHQSISGLALDVFMAVREMMPHPFQYVLTAHNGTYDSMIEQIYLKNYDVVVGDTTIVASRTQYGQFSQPWMDSGLQMVVLTSSVMTNQPWLFFKPFTAGMWFSVATLNMFNGVVILLMERKHYHEFNGSLLNRLGFLIWLAFATLFALHSDRLHRILPQVTMVVWVFVALVTIQSYSASFSSMLTVTRINANDITVENLLKNNAKVGCDEISFVVNYLEEVLHFPKENIQKIPSEMGYPQALESGEITAAFLEVPYIKIFLAKNCKRFAAVGPVYKVGGFGFVFSRGSQMLDDISQGILELSENGKLLKLEETMMGSIKCSDSADDPGRLDVSSFWGLFLISGTTSAVSLLIFLVQSFIATIREKPDYNQHDPAIDEIVMFASEMRREDNLHG
ncbi:hypothetical protein ACHQM5_017667 [Ranunculus cassubicifolius]